MPVPKTVCRFLMASATILMFAACSNFAFAGVHVLEYRVTAFDGYSQFKCIRSGSSTCYVAFGKKDGTPSGAHRIAVGEMVRINNPDSELSYCVNPDKPQEWPTCSTGLWTGALSTSHSTKQIYADAK
jgi:hypothetical protein